MVKVLVIYFYIKQVQYQGEVENGVDCFDGWYEIIVVVGIIVLYLDNGVGLGFIVYQQLFGCFIIFKCYYFCLWDKLFYFMGFYI